MINRACCAKFATGLNTIISHSSKSIWLIKLSFCQNNSPMGGSFWQKDSLITHILFELWLIMVFRPVANFAQQILYINLTIAAWNFMSLITPSTAIWFMHTLCSALQTIKWFSKNFERAILFFISNFWTIQSKPERHTTEEVEWNHCKE